MLTSEQHSSEIRLLPHSVLDRISDSVICCDGDGQITFINQAAARLIDCAPALARGQSLERFFPGSQAIFKGRSRTAEHRLSALRGAREPLTVQAIVEHSRAPGGSVFTVVVPHQHLSAARSQDSARLAAIVESSDDAIIGKTLDGIITSWNRGAQRIFGYSADEMVGEHISKLIPPGREKEEPDILERLGRGEHVDHFDTVRRAKDGALIDVSLTISPIRDENDNIVGASKIARDIGERKRSAAARETIEQRMRLAIEAAQMGIWDWDLRSREIVWSRRFADLLGIDSLTGTFEVFERCLHPDDRAETRIKLLRALETQSEYRHIEFRVIWPDRSVHWLEGRGRAVTDDNGRPVRMLGFVVDISARKQAEEQNRVHEAELAHLSRVGTMGNIASGLAHELNQPLGAIMNYAGVCLNLAKLSPVPAPQLAIALEEAMNETRRASAIISRLRSFVSKQAPKSVRVNVNDLVRKSVELLNFELRHEMVSPQLQLATGLPPAMADAIQIEQVLVNLICNAMQAMQESVPPKKLVIETAQLQDGRINVSVTDSGHGMSAQHLARLFEPFFTTKSQGLGMGLNISRSIIESHGGRLWASNNADGGMRFTFTLPSAT